MVTSLTDFSCYGSVTQELLKPLLKQFPLSKGTLECLARLKEVMLPRSVFMDTKLYQLHIQLSPLLFMPPDNQTRKGVKNMFLRILKKDMKVRKSINFILFLFIMISSVFLSSSVSNIAVVSSAIDYFLDYSNVPDVMLIATSNEEVDDISKWLKEEASYVDSFDYEELIIVPGANISTEMDGEKKEFKTEGAEIVIGTFGNQYCKFYDTDDQTFSLKEGEIALGKTLMESNKLKPGDQITIGVGEVQKTFTIKENTKDAVFGSEMSGMQRLVLNEKDYEEVVNQEEISMFSLHYVESKQVEKCVQEVNDKNFSTIANVQTRETYTLIYSMDMIMAALLIFIGLCLIFIAFLVLRFALVFTIEEDYREIGIMKAIGMRDFSIKKIYLTKYLFLVVTGAVLGLFMSIPVSTVMVKSVSRNMIMESSSSKIGINVVCTIMIIAVVMLFCYRCTKKLNKISAIAAIRGGQSGERYGKRAGFALHKRGKMPVIFFMGLNDIRSNIRRYLILLFTFCISFILITIPLNTLNTMRSREMVEKFDLNPDSAVYVRDIEESGEQFKNSQDVQEGVSRLKRQLKEKGYDTKLTYGAIFFIHYGNQGEDAKISIMTIQMKGDNTDFLVYDEGTAPKLENEIAFSKQILKLNEWKIGDTVEVVINGEQRPMIITGTYTDYMQLGQSARLNPVIDCSHEVMFDYWHVMVDFETTKTQAEVKEELKEKFPDYEWSTAQEIIDLNVGGIQQTLDDMLYPMTGLLCVLIMLITMLMERLFIVREKGEIAMLKSIGYRTRDIRLWQVIRMVLVAVISMVVAVPLSLLSNQFILKPIFGIMGAQVDIQVEPWKVYGVFPAVLLAGIIIAAIFATRSIKKIHIQEMNKAE